MPGTLSMSSAWPGTTLTFCPSNWEPISADCERARVLTRLLIWVSEIWAASIPISKPRPEARRSSVRTPVEAMKVLDGTQSKSTQAPPIPSESTTVTSATSEPWPAATSAAS